MAAELVNAITRENLKEMDWAKSIEICEIFLHDQGQAREVIKSLKRRLGSKNPNTLLFSVMLLEILMNNCGEHIHKLVIEGGILPILVKIVKKWADLPVGEKIFLLLDATQISLGGASGKFPQYHAAYCDLINAGIQFAQRPSIISSDDPNPSVQTVSSHATESVTSRCENVSEYSTSKTLPEPSIIEKATSTMEVLREVLDALDTQNPEGAKDEFTIDLVEQCSFQKQRVMHLVMTSRDENLVSQAIELNDQLQKVLLKHDALISATATKNSPSSRDENIVSQATELNDQQQKVHLKHDALISAPATITSPSSFEDEEVQEEEEVLFQRIRRGKGHSDDRLEISSSARVSGVSVPGERHNRPFEQKPISLDSVETNTSLPPPPAKYKERERYFKEKQAEGTTLPSQMTGLSLHSLCHSSSLRESADSNE